MSPAFIIIYHSLNETWSYKYWLAFDVTSYMTSRMHGHPFKLLVVDVSDAFCAKKQINANENKQRANFCLD